MKAKLHMIRMLLGTLVVVLGPGTPPRAQEIVADVSREIVELRYDFAGTELLLFGAVKGAGQATERLDVVVALAGPAEPIVIRRKTEVAGLLWINTEEAGIPSAPGFFALASTRPLGEVAQEGALEALDLGPAYLPIDVEGPVSEVERRNFREAFFRRMQAAGLYRLHPGGVHLAENALFRTTVDLPANVPAGDFEARIYLFVDGRLADRRQLAINVDKTGFERSLFAFAHGYPFLYGLSAVIVALLAGWLAGLAARR